MQWDIYFDYKIIILDLLHFSDMDFLQAHSGRIHATFYASMVKI